MTQYAQLPDGTYAEFPDEATPEQMAQALNSIQSAQPPKPSGFESIVNALSRNIAQPFNRGLLGLPGMLPGGDSLKADARRLGMIEPQGQEATGIIPNTMEILGGAVLPAGSALKYGGEVLKRGIPLAKRSILQNVAAETASAPRMAAAGEVLAALGGGVGREVGGDTGEIIGAATAAATPAVAVPAGRAAAWTAGKVADVAEKLPVVGSLTRMGRDVWEAFRGLPDPYYRAAKTLQSTVRDPQEAADMIDLTSAMPPLRQIGSERTLQLEADLRARSSPAETEKIQADIQQSVADQKAKAVDVGGDTTAPRQIITEQSQALIDDANKAIADVDPGAKPWEISEDTMGRVRAAEDAADADVKAAWSEVGLDAPGSYSNLESTLADIEAESGRSVFRKAIPEEVRAELEAAAQEGAETTLRDIQGLRSQVLGLLRSARMDPEKAPMVRWLTKMESALLKDMNAVQTDNPAALAAAREATKRFNDQFRRGKMGEVLGFGEGGAERVLPSDALKRVFSGTESARGLEQMIEAAPESRQGAIDFLRSQFLASAVNADGSFNQSAANRFISTLRGRRIFEVLPELEEMFTTASSKQMRAKTLADADEVLAGPQNALSRLEAKKSLAATFLEAPAEKEAAILLDPKNGDPVRNARRLISRMGGNEAAEEGLRQSFREAMWDAAKQGVDPEGFPLHDAGRFSAAIRDNMATMQALGFSEGNIQDLKRLATLMRQAQADVPRGNAGDPVVFDLPGRIMARVNRIIGANMGNWFNKVLGGNRGAGVSLQSAQMGATTMQQIGEALRFDPAERLLIMAMDDPALMKALLLRDSASEAAKKSAAAKLNAWAAGVGLTDDSESE